MSSSPIADSETLHRRIFPGHMKPDGTLSTAAFNDPAMSVDRAAMRTCAESLKDHPGYGLASFQAGFARSKGQEVIPDPELLNLAHALVNGRKSKAIRKDFVSESKLIQAPTSVAETPTREPKPRTSASEPPPSP